MYTRASPTDILARKSARVGQKYADKSARIVMRVRLVASWTGEDSRAEVGEEDSVGVGVRVGPVEFKLNTAAGRNDYRWEDGPWRRPANAS